MGKIIVNTQVKKSKINKNIYGHFSEHLGHCIYGGLFVGEDSSIPNIGGIRTDVVNALRNIRVPVLRWPGGCFADEYHWKDGIGPKKDRKKMVNTNWGGLVEDNSFGTHEFMELCRQVGCEPYVNGNCGSGTVQEMSEWVEYLTFGGQSPMTELRKKNGRAEPWPVKYFAVGNETWGGGGNMQPEYYADLYLRYQTFLRNYGDNKLFRIASGANSGDYRWTKVLMERAARYMDGITLHYYTIPGDSWQHKGSATDFTEEEYYTTLKKALRMEDIVENHSRVMDHYDPQRRVGLMVDEWGTWYDVEPGTNPGFLYQQNTMRDALVAALTLNIFNRHSDRVVMANIAQMVNVLQAVILTDGEKMLLTPTYHVYDLYKDHQDAQLVESFAAGRMIGTETDQVPSLSVSASEDAEGTLHITAANTSLKDADPVECEILGRKPGSVSARILTGAMDARNDFDTPENVRVQDFGRIPVSGSCLKFTMPPCSVMEITVE